MSRKDIFYSGSVLNLPEYRSQKSLSSYRQSILSLPKSMMKDKEMDDDEEIDGWSLTIKAALCERVLHLKG